MKGFERGLIESEMIRARKYVVGNDATYSYNFEEKILTVPLVDLCIVALLNGDSEALTTLKWYLSVGSRFGQMR